MSKQCPRYTVIDYACNRGRPIGLIVGVFLMLGCCSKQKPTDYDATGFPEDIQSRYQDNFERGAKFIRSAVAGDKAAMLAITGDASINAEQQYVSMFGGCEKLIDVSYRDLVPDYNGRKGVIYLDLIWECSNHRGGEVRMQQLKVGDRWNLWLS